MKRLAVSVLALSALAGCSSGNDDSSASRTATVLNTQQLRVGSVSTTDAPAKLAKTATPVITPNGATTVGVGHASSQSIVGGTRLAATNDAALVPVTWTFTPSSGGVDPGTKRTALVLNAGGKNYVLSADVSSGGKVVVAVPKKDVGSVSARVVFDNLAQSVDTAKGTPIVTNNASSIYYDGKSLKGRGTCPQFDSGDSGTGLRFTSTCGLVSIQRTPWLPGRGWASKDAQWISVKAILAPGTMTFTNAAKQKVTYPTLTTSIPYATMNGTPAVAVSKQNNAFTIDASIPKTSSVAASLTEKFVGRATGGVPADVPMQQTITSDITANIIFDPATN